jgi:hypothetical protein
LGLQIHDANITTFNGKFLNILKIESWYSDGIKILDKNST